MAIAFVAAAGAQKSGRSAYTGATNGFSLGTFNAGELVLIGVFNWSATISSIVWGTGGSAAPTLVATRHPAGANPQADLYVVTNTSAGTHRLDVTLGATSDCTVIAFRFSGATTSTTARDSGTDRDASTGTPSVSTAGSAAQVGDLCVAGFTHDQSTAGVTAGSGFTIPTNGSFTNGSFVPAAMEYDTDNVSSAGTQSAGVSWAVASYSEVLAVFAPAAAGGGAPPLPRRPLRIWPRVAWLSRLFPNDRRRPAWQPSMHERRVA